MSNSTMDIRRSRELLSSGGISVLISVVQRVRRCGVKEDTSMAAAEIDLLRTMNALVGDGKNHEVGGMVASRHYRCISPSRAHGMAVILNPNES